MAAVKPEVTIVKEGKTYVQTNATPWKTISSRLTPGEILEADMFGSGTISQAGIFLITRLVLPCDRVCFRCSS
jgi:hypothetical protein